MSVDLPLVLFCSIDQIDSEKITKNNDCCVAFSFISS